MTWREVAAEPDAPSRGSWRIALWATIALLLLLPLLAMQFTREVAWTGFDFVVAALLLIGGGAAYDLVTRRVADRKRRIVFGAMIVAVVLLVWAQGAIGIF